MTGQRNPYEHLTAADIRDLTDDELLKVGCYYAERLSFYEAGWDYSNTRHERPAHRACERASQPVHDELCRRGLTTRGAYLRPLGV